MADFENSTFKDWPDPYDAADDDTFNLPHAVMNPPPDVEQGLRAAWVNLQNLRGKLRRKALSDQKRRLFDTFYKEVGRAYKGLRLEGSTDYEQFGIDDYANTLYWTPGDKKIPITATWGGFRFLALSTLASKYGTGGINAIRQSLGLTDYKSNMPRLNKEAADTVQKAEETLPKILNPLS